MCGDTKASAFGLGKPKGFKIRITCALTRRSTRTLWAEADGSLHAILPGDTPEEAQLASLSKSYQESIRNSPMWMDMVKEFGEAKAEKLLAQCRAEVHP